MTNNTIKYLVINVRETLGDKVLLLSSRPLAKYIEGIKGEQEGITVTCLSERMAYEKVDVKIVGLMELPFEFNNTPIPVSFEGLEGKIWQDWEHKGELKFSISAQGIKPLSSKHIKLEGENRT